jgi:hypothetical protein
VFDSIVVRSTTQGDGVCPIDLGRLAEAMLFYRTVRLVMTWGDLGNLLKCCGPDLVLEMLDNPGIDAILVDGEMRVMMGGGLILPLSPPPFELDEARVVAAFQEFTGDIGKGRRMAQRFLARARYYHLPADLTDAVRRDWQDTRFLRRAITEVLKELAPTYTLPTNLKVTLIKQNNGAFTFKSNLDWSAIQRKAVGYWRDRGLDVSGLLVWPVYVRESLHFGATFGAGVVQNLLGAKLMQAKCADLAASLGRQQAEIARFHQVVVGGLSDVRGAVNSGAFPFKDFLRILPDAEHFRNWLDTQTPDADLVRAYFEEATKRHALSSLPVRELRWLLPTAAGFALFLPHADVVAPSVAGSLAAADRYIVSRFCEGWRPAIFVDTKLRPSVNR